MMLGSARCMLSPMAACQARSRRSLVPAATAETIAACAGGVSQAIKCRRRTMHVRRKLDLQTCRRVPRESVPDADPTTPSGCALPRAATIGGTLLTTTHAHDMHTAHAATAKAAGGGGSGGGVGGTPVGGADGPKNYVTLTRPRADPLPQTRRNQHRFRAGN